MPAFSYSRPHLWFSAATLGFLTLGNNTPGVQGLMNALDLGSKYYDGMCEMFRSAAINLENLRFAWVDFLVKNCDLMLTDELIMFVSDGVKAPKEVRKMPRVCRLHNNSDTQSKPSSFHGIQGGSIGIVATSKQNPNEAYVIPISMELFYGLAPIADWEGTPHTEAELPLEDACSIRQTDYVNHLGIPALSIQDRASMTIAIFQFAAEYREGGETPLYVLTNAKRNVVAWELPPKYSGIGRPKIKGDKHHLKD